MKAETRIRRVQLQVERSGFYGLLFFAGEFGEAVGEGVGDTETHGRPSVQFKLIIVETQTKISVYRSQLF